jgi:cytochrome c
MDSFEFNKIAGAVLATALGVMALSIVSEIVFHPAEAEQPAYVVAGVEPTGDEHGGAAGEPASDLPPIAVRLATADITAGERSMAKCKACHTFEDGNTRRTPGPNLYGIVGAPVAHLEGFSYSSAMTAKHDEGQTWTFEYLDEYLFAPRAVIPGTAMTFAGLKRDDERTNVIAYLRTLSNSPVPLPEVPTAAAPETEAPAAPEGEAGPGEAAPGEAEAPSP